MGSVSLSIMLLEDLELQLGHLCLPPSLLLLGMGQQNQQDLLN
jgi:hypothetical protein